MMVGFLVKNAEKKGGSVLSVNPKSWTTLPFRFVASTSSMMFRSVATSSAGRRAFTVSVSTAGIFVFWGRHRGRKMPLMIFYDLEHGSDELLDVP